jgi:predicted ATPase
MNVVIRFSGVRGSILPASVEGSDLWVVVEPSLDRFDDFGTSSHVDINLYVKGKHRVIKAKMLLRPRNGKDIVPDTSSTLAKQYGSGGLHDTDAIGESFLYLSQLQSRRDYREFVAFCGQAAAIAALSKLHDAGTLRRFQADIEDFVSLSDAQAFARSLLRFDSAFVAYWDSSRLLTAPEGLVAYGMLDRLPLEVPSLGSGSLPIALEFSDGLLGRQRSNVLIGENGVGKSRLLRAIATSQEAFPRDMRSKISEIVFIPSPLDAPLGAVLPAGTRILRHPALDEGWLELTTKLCAMFRDEATADQGGHPGELFLRAIEPFIDGKKLALPLRRASTTPVRDTFAWEGRQYFHVYAADQANESRRADAFGFVDAHSPPIIATPGEQPHVLSSGERALLGLMVLLIHDLPRYGLLLLDEPELSMHPKMIAQLMRTLNFLLESREAACVVATHSLYVIREVSSGCVHVLKRAAELPHDLEVYRPMLQTLGAGLGELSNVVFDDVNIEQSFKHRIDERLASVDRPPTTTMLQAELDELGAVGIATMRRMLDKESAS